MGDGSGECQLQYLQKQGLVPSPLTSVSEPGVRPIRGPTCRAWLLQEPEGGWCEGAKGESMGKPRRGLRDWAPRLSSPRRKRGPQAAKDLGLKAQCSHHHSTHTPLALRGPLLAGLQPCDLHPKIQHWPLRAEEPSGSTVKARLSALPPPGLRAPVQLGSCRPSTFLPSSGLQI